MSAPPDLLLCFEDEQTLAHTLVQEWGCPVHTIDRHVFPDGEIKLRLPPALPGRVVLLRSLFRPNTKLVELLLAAQTARTLGAKQLSLVAPYLAYMRQDVAFHPGEAISQKIVGRFLAELFDAVLTVDPHLHRVSTLKEAVPAPVAIALSAAPLLADHIYQHHPQALLIGPDEESAQWIAVAAQRHRFDQGVCRKVRHGDRQVEVTLPVMAFAQRAVVLLDDIASSGHTLAQTARLLLKAGAASVDVAVTHALFSDDAMQVIRAAGIGQVWSTDCVPHHSNCIHIAPLITQTWANADDTRRDHDD